MKQDELVGVCTDAPAMFGSQSGFIVRIKQKSPNAVGSHCVVQLDQSLGLQNTICCNDKLAVTIQAADFVRTSAVNERLFAKLCNDMDSNHDGRSCFINLFGGHQKVIR